LSYFLFGMSFFGDLVDNESSPDGRHLLIDLGISQPNIVYFT